MTGTLVQKKDLKELCICKDKALNWRNWKKLIHNVIRRMLEQCWSDDSCLVPSSPRFMCINSIKCISFQSVFVF